jgi:hypothetical protein
MIKMLIMIECNQCGSTFPDVVSQVNDTNLPFFRMHDVLLNLDNAGWLSQKSASVHTCYDCQHSDNYRDEEVEAPQYKWRLLND